MKTWWVHKADGSCLGQVAEKNDELARCAALSKYAPPDDEFELMSAEQQRFHIGPNEDFSVRQA